jgi:hypothetical protein
MSSIINFICFSVCCVLVESSPLISNVGFIKIEEKLAVIGLAIIETLLNAFIIKILIYTLGI